MSIYRFPQEPGYQVLGIVYLNQLSGARYQHLTYHDKISNFLQFGARTLTPKPEIVDNFCIDKTNLLTNFFCFRLKKLLMFLVQNGVHNQTIGTNLTWLVKKNSPTRT